MEQATSSYVLPEILDLRAAGPLASELTHRRGAAIALDASKVRRLGGQCLQVLLSAHVSWSKDRAPFSIVNSSKDFTDSLVLLGAQFLLST
jgi:chemotaxis protein CheX